MSRNYKVFITCILILFMIILTGLNYNVNADMGAKPSITINLENIDTKNYLIDLLVYDESGENYSSPLDYNGKKGEQYSTTSGYDNLKTITVEQLETLHKINYDGWISEGTRWDAYLLFADCSGNNKHEHYFSYFGTPETYKAVIVFNDGETRVTDVIHRTDFQSEIIIDVNTMEVVSKGSVPSALKSILIPLLVTIIVEIIIALVMKLKNIKVILLTNVITNILLQLLLIYTPLSYILTFLILETLIFITEYLIYKKYFKDISKQKIISYTLLANLATVILTFVF